MTLEEKVDALCRIMLDGEHPDAKEKIKAIMLSAGPQKAEYHIREILMELGAPDHLVGHPYVIRAIELVIEDSLYIKNITGGLYPKLAEEFDTSAAKVERAIRNLIEVSSLRCDLDVMYKYFGNTISTSRGKPTNGEFIARLANVVKGRMHG